MRLKRVVLSLAIGSLAVMGTAYADVPEFRTYDGSGNNLANPDWGMAGTQLLRLTDPAYVDAISSPFGAGLPGPREISNGVAAQSGPVFSSKGISDFVWQWGQFLDHDMDLTPAGMSELLNIPVPTGDPYFDPASTGTAEIGFFRSIYDPATGTDAMNPRQQVNIITSFIDASNVYGSDATRALFLREGVGGLLKTSAGNLLPYEAGGSDMFAAGDVRANEQVGLTSMHTLFVREHNRLAAEIGAAFAVDPAFDDERIYQEARRIVGAELQMITYNEFLPYLLGTNALSPYAGYDPFVNPGISDIFSTAGFRFGHSMLPEELLRLDGDGDVIAEGNLPLKDAFFSPDRLVSEGGIDPILRGLATQTVQELDPLITDAVRNFLFGPPGAGGFDLASLNLQRGRDHGLPRYNDAREAFGLTRIMDFSDPIFQSGFGAALASVYGSVDDIDLWIGLLTEEHAHGGVLGELAQAILKEQFTRLRDGDRFWYENVEWGEMSAFLGGTTLAQVVRRNTPINIQNDAFTATTVTPEPATCALMGVGLVCLVARRRSTSSRRG